MTGAGRLRDLNVFLAWSMLGALGMSLFLGVHPMISIPLAVAVPAWTWFTGRLLPEVSPIRPMSCRSWGQWLIAAANVVFIAGVFSPVLVGVNIGRYSMVPAVSLWVVGLACVYGALAGRQADRADAAAGRSDIGVSARRVAVLLIGGIGLAGASYVISTFFSYNRWREEVQLSDGSVLVVNRSVRYRRGSEPGIGATRWALEETLTINDVATGSRIVWPGDHRVAGLVDQIQGRYWIVGKLTTVCAEGHVGAPRWQAYRYENGKWYATSQSDAPNLSTPNLLFDAFEYPVTARLRYVGLEEKRDLDRSSRVDDLYRTIDLSFVPRC